MSRRNSYTGKYKLTKEEFLSAKYYALRYQAWIQEYNALKDAVKAIQYGDKTTGGPSDSSTERLAIRREELSRKVRIIEEAAREADMELQWYLLKAATCEGITFHHLKTMYKMPCERDMYYDRRRKFYWILSKKI